MNFLIFLQVDLKLKVCRGSSVRKIIVRETNLFAANKVILGTAAKHHTIRSSISVAKYCAKKLPNDCSVLAVRNGKVVFQREATSSVAGISKNTRGFNLAYPLNFVFRMPLNVVIGLLLVSHLLI